MPPDDVHYITDTDGHQVGVILPTDLWREIASERGALHGAKKKDRDKCSAEGGGRVTDMTLEEAGIKICAEIGLPVFRVSPDAPKMTTEFVKQLEEEWCASGCWTPICSSRWRGRSMLTMGR